jgi:hypothetical protein
MAIVTRVTVSWSLPVAEGAASKPLELEVGSVSGFVMLLHWCSREGVPKMGITSEHSVSDRRLGGDERSWLGSKCGGFVLYQGWNIRDRRAASGKLFWRWVC